MNDASLYKILVSIQYSHADRRVIATQSIVSTYKYAEKGRLASRIRRDTEQSSYKHLQDLLSESVHKVMVVLNACARGAKLIYDYKRRS